MGWLVIVGSITVAALLAAHPLRQRLPDRTIDAVPTPHTAQDRTDASAVWVRNRAVRRVQPLKIDTDLVTR